MKIGKLKFENEKMKSKILTICAISTLTLGLASCSNLQDSLSSEQLTDQKEDIGYISSPTSTYYYNGKSGESIKGNEAHLTLSLNQFANAEKATVDYELSYKLNDISYTSKATGKGTLSSSKSKFYVDLSPATNLIDGTESPATSDISYTISVSGLTNASGGDYNGRAMPNFSKKISFAPLYPEKFDDFSTKFASPGYEFEIPLNGKISSVEKEITTTVKSGTMPATTFTASASADGKAILLKTSADLKNAEFTADFAFTGIKAVGSKETYSYTLTNLSFTALTMETVKGNLVFNKEAQKIVDASVFAEYDSISEINVYAKLGGDASGWWAGICDSSSSNWGDLTWKDAGSARTYADYQYEGSASNDLKAKVKSEGLYIKGLATLNCDYIVVIKGRTN